MAKLVQDYLRQHGVERLEDRFKVITKRHGEFPNLVLFKYDQLNSPMGDPLVQQCRGLILDEANDWAVVSYPYDKFFNYGEGHAKEIDWSSARVYEKLDGSLMTLYPYQGTWHVSSSGLPDASGSMMGTTTTFKELFWKVWSDLGYRLPPYGPQCYMFELMTPFNRVVVRHKESRIMLHGGRRLTDFRELNPVVEAHHNGWECVPIHRLDSWDAIMETAKTLNPMESEGYVVADANYNRVKVKAPQYVAVAHMKDGFSTRRMLEIVRTNENSEFLSYYPEFTDMYYEIRFKYERLLGEMQGFYDAIKDIPEQKDFARQATKKHYSGALFQMRRNGTDFKKSLAEMQIKLLEEWLGVKHIDLSGSQDSTMPDRDDELHPL